MHPDFRIASARMRAAALRDFIFMMWKHQIRAAAMNIEIITEIFRTHRRAFNMPARTPFAPR